MNKIKKSVITLFITICVCFTNIFTIYAEPNIKKIYSIDTNNVGISARPFLQSLVIDDDTKAVTINNTAVGSMSSDSQTFRYVSDSYTADVNVDLANQTYSASIQAKVQEKHTLAFKFEIENKKYYVCYFYPDYGKSSSSQKIQSVRNGDIHNFNTFSHTYGGKTETYDVQLVQSNGQVYINGSYVGTLQNIEVPIIFEWLGNGPTGTSFIIKDEAYQAFLTNVNWPKASQNAPVYNRSFENKVVATNQTDMYEASNEYLNLPSRWIQYKTKVNLWHRVSGTSQSGTGSWEQVFVDGKPVQIETVCEYDENNECGQNARKNFSKYWIINGTKARKISNPVKTKLDNINVKAEYKNYVYSDSSWKETSTYPSSAGENVAIQGASRTANWSNWTDWSPGYAPATFTSNENLKIEEKELKKYRTYTWSDVGGWSTNATVCSYISSTDGRAQSKSATDEACGVNQYNYCVNKNAGCKTYNSCTSGSCGYATCRSSGCGCETYNSCRDSACGTESYQSSSSGCANYHKQTCGGDAYSCQTGTNYVCSTCYRDKKVCNRYTGSGQCVSYTTTKEPYSCGCHNEPVYGTCRNPTYDCSYTTYDAPCYGTRNKSCRAAACGCDTYKSCAHQGCGYATCVTEACGCGTWNSSRDASCGVESYKTCTFYKCQIKDFSDWVGPNETCPYLSGVDVECASAGEYYRYKNRSWSDWSSWSAISSSLGINATEIQYKYRYNEGKVEYDDHPYKGQPGSSAGWYSGETTPGKTKLISNAEITISAGSEKSYDVQKMQTYDNVVTWQNQYAFDTGAARAYAVLNTANKKEGIDYVLWSDVKEKASLDQSYSDAKRYIQSEASIYQPYLYFWGAMFTPEENVSLPQGSVSGSPVFTYEYVTITDSGSLLVSEEVIRRDTKVIYYDYHDPLTYYKDDLPENWEGYEYFIEEIQNSDMDSPKITVKLSADDISAMKEWLDNGGYDTLGSCEMLREFSYIFVGLDDELSAWLASGKSCKIESAKKEGE